MYAVDSGEKQSQSQGFLSRPKPPKSITVNAHISRPQTNTSVYFYLPNINLGVKVSRNTSIRYNSWQFLFWILYLKYTFLNTSHWLLTHPVVLSWCLTSSRNSSTSCTSLYLFQFFFLFLFTRFLRLLTRSVGVTLGFKVKKPGCETATRFTLLAAAMLED